MKFSQVAAAAAFAALANAQSQCLSLVTGIPACALGYIAEIAYSSFTCDIVDFACQCSNLNNLQVPVLSSLGSGPCAGSVGQVLNGASTLCGCVTSNSPSSVSLESYQKACEPSAVAIPGCALGYLASAGIADGCQINDFACQCSNFQMINGQISNDVSSYCAASATPVQYSDVVNSANALCACVSASDGGAAPTASATPTGTGAAPTATGASTSPIVSGPTATTKAGTSPSGATTAKSSPSGVKSQPVFTGAGVTASAFGGVFGVVAGLAALL